MKALKSYLLCLPVIIFVLIGCATPYPNKMVQLNRDRYVCKFDSAPYNNLKGTRILLSTITDKAKNTTNLAYYNSAQTIGYELYYSSSSMRQPVVSYFWYSLKKAFECAGIRIEEHGPIYDAELHVTLNSLTDEEIKISALLTKMGKLLYSGEHVITMPKVRAEEESILEQRAYAMLDSIVTAILDDTKFQQALMDKAAPPVPLVQKYEKIRGVVLKNGETIVGDIISMNVESVQIRTTDGRVLSYSFTDEVQSLIKE